MKLQAAIVQHPPETPLCCEWRWPNCY